MLKSKIKGTCLRYINGLQIVRSKYSTEEDAKEYFDMYLRLDVINKNYSVYKCPKCKMYHIGNSNIECNE